MFFSSFRRHKGTVPVDGSPQTTHREASSPPPLKRLKESFKHLTGEFDSDPMGALICHIIESIQVMSTITIPNTGTGSRSTKSISTVATVCNSTFYDVMEIILAEVFCTQPAFALSEAEAQFCNMVGCRIVQLYPSFLGRALNERTKKTLLHIVSQQPVLGLETVSFIHRLCPQQAAQLDASGALPLHYAAHSLHPSQPLIVQYLLRSFPDGVRAADKEGYLPLHWAVNSKALRKDSVFALVGAYPEGVRHKCNGGTLPLHWAVDRDDATIDVVQLLHEHNPEAHHQTSVGDWLPLHRCVDRDKVNLEVLQFLIQQNPKGLLRGNSDGHLPIHRLVDREHIDTHALECIIRTCPESLAMADLEGYLPLHTLLEAQGPESDLQAFRMVLEAYPDAASLPTSDGLCPLHCAMIIGQAWNFAVLQTLVAAYPGGCVEEAVDTEPEDPAADPVTYTGRWRKYKWTPLSRATEVGDKQAMDLLKRTINKLALQKMTHNKAVTSPQRPGGASNGEQLPLKLKSSQVAAIASKQPKQGPVVLPRPHMKSAHRIGVSSITDGEILDDSVVMPIQEEEFGLADIHGTSQKSSPEKGAAAAVEDREAIELPGAVHVEDSDWVDDDAPSSGNRALPRNPDLIRREQEKLSSGRSDTVDREGSPGAHIETHLDIDESDDSMMITVVGDDDSAGGETQYTMQDRRHARTKDAKKNRRIKQASTPGGIAEGDEGDTSSPLKSGKGHRTSGKESAPKGAGLNLAEREAERRRELEKQKLERAARHAEKKEKKRRDKDHHSRKERDSSKEKDRRKYNTAVASDILGSGKHGQISTQFNYDTADTPVGGGEATELRMTGSDSSGNLQPTQLFDSPADHSKQSQQAPLRGVIRANSNLHTIVEKDVEIDSPMKPARPAERHVGEPMQPSSFDEDDHELPKGRGLNLAEREKERLRELDRQKQARDKQLVVKQTVSKSGKERVVVRPSSSWGKQESDTRGISNGADNDVDSALSGHYNTNSAKQILEKASSRDEPSESNVEMDSSEPVALFERHPSKRGPGGETKSPVRPSSAHTNHIRNGTGNSSFGSENGPAPRARPMSAKVTAVRSSLGGSSKRLPPDDDEASVTSRASRKIALEHMNNNFG